MHGKKLDSFFVCDIFKIGASARRSRPARIAKCTRNRCPGRPSVPPVHAVVRGVNSSRTSAPSVLVCRPSSPYVHAVRPRRPSVLTGRAALPSVPYVRAVRPCPPSKPYVRAVRPCRLSVPSVHAVRPCRPFLPSVSVVLWEPDSTRMKECSRVISILN